MDPLITVVGATGTGKSKLAVDLAARFNGEIINGDAMQMYRGLPIITNQIPLNERKDIPHHLLSCVDLDTEAWRIGHFKREALRLIADIRSRGKLPILVGGTHYYTQAVLFKDQLVGEGCDLEAETTAKTAKETQKLDSTSTSEKWPILDSSPEVLMQKLREVDPVMAARWHPKDGRKIRRSLEIYFQTGRPASEIYAEQQEQKQKAVTQTEGGLLRFDNTLIFWVHAEKEILNQRLDARVDGMIEQGMMAEAETMYDFIQQKKAEGVEVDQTRGVWVSIGFKELAPYFAARHEGVLNEDELGALRRQCIDAIRTATRQYGGSQIKWIRNKLWRALADAGMTQRLYLLDSSDVAQWTSRITEPSEDIVRAVKQGASTPDPKSLSALARTILGAREEQGVSSTSPLKAFTCDVCAKTVVGDAQWEIHLNSYGHKRGLKSAARKAERDEYFRKRAVEEQGEGSEKDADAKGTNKRTFERIENE
ncbi:tRNA dimethylallyltransferase [Penicillium ucsense]|uniref:tRNA dimethylallyltransferase n=1 Tax=Penicillium ucsense TaxID=2839758 RepID=A0A8J8VYE6_9EURO|nr:tRNA dimethylallyltransferase [Penicillium ucsense]KAF7733689.1 tRNA dimethylallyltransferase [Penicillium ucsense]